MSTAETRRQSDGFIERLLGGIPIEVGVPFQFSESVIRLAIVGIKFQCLLYRVPRGAIAVLCGDFSPAEKDQTDVGFGQTRVGRRKVRILSNGIFKVGLGLIE